MDILTNLLTNDAFLNAVIAGIGLVLTFLINRVAGAFQVATGMSIEARHREALHSAILTYVESSLKHGHDVGLDYLKANTLDYLKRSVPDALKALTPGDGVLDRLVERYAVEAMAKLDRGKAIG